MLRSWYQFPPSENIGDVPASSSILCGCSVWLIALIQGDSRIVDITAGDDFQRLGEQESFLSLSVLLTMGYGRILILVSALL